MLHLTLHCRAMLGSKVRLFKKRHRGSRTKESAVVSSNMWGHPAGNKWILHWELNNFIRLHNFTNQYHNLHLFNFIWYCILYTYVFWWATDETHRNYNKTKLYVCFSQVLIQYGRRLCPLHFTWLRWFWCVFLSGTMTQLEETLLVNVLLPSAAWCQVCAQFTFCVWMIWT